MKDKKAKMKKIFVFLTLLFIILPVWSFYKIPKGMENYVKTADGETIAFDWRKSGHKEVLVIAPGWFMTKNTHEFKEISKAFSDEYDVICMDFRGHGTSSGRYTFSSEEISDMKAIVDFAKKRYEKVDILGFSLGGTVAILYTAQYGGINKLITVSAPADFKKVENQMWKKEAYIPTINKYFSNFRYTKIPRNIRIGNIFAKKTAALDVVNKINCPHLLIYGTKDPIVHPWHTLALYFKSDKNAKLGIFPNCYHAEDIYAQQSARFMSICKEWLEKS